MAIALSAGVVTAATITKSGSIGGSPFTHEGAISYTVDYDQGNATITVTGQSGSYNSDPETLTDARLLIDYFGTQTLELGQSHVYPEGSTVLLFVQVNYSGWQILGSGEEETLGEAHYRVPYNYTNDTAWSGTIEWFRIDNIGPVETAAHSVSIGPGETVAGSWLAADGPNQYLVTITYDGVEETGELGWVVSDGVSTSVEMETVSDIEMENAIDEPPTPAEKDTPTNEDDPEAPPSGASIQTGQKTGETDLTVKTTTNPTGSLTEGTFESAIGQVIKAVRNISTGGSTTVNVDTDGITDALGENKTELQAANSSLNSIDGTLTNMDTTLTEMRDTQATTEARELAESEAQTALLDENPDTAEMQSAGQQAASDLELLLPDASGISVPTETTGSGMDFTVSLPSTMGGATFDLDPFRSDRLGPAITWFRGAVAWLAIMLFGAWVFQETRIIVGDIPKLPQARGNPVVGGTGGQATALIAAALITAIMATVVVGLVGWVFGDIGFAYIITVASSNPLTGMPANAAWMLNQVFPIATLLTVLVGRISFNAWAMKYYAIASSLIRFIVT